MAASAIQKAIDDPVENFIGAFSSNIPDWADEHDKYLGLALMGQLGDLTPTAVTNETKAEIKAP